MSHEDELLELGLLGMCITEYVEVVRCTTVGMSGDVSSLIVSRLVEIRGRTVVGGDAVLRVGGESSVSGCTRSESNVRMGGEGRGVGGSGKEAESRVSGRSRRCTSAGSVSWSEICRPFLE